MRRYLDGKWLILMAFNLLVLVMVFVKTEPVNCKMQDLSSLEQRLIVIETSLNQPSAQPDLSPVTRNLKQLEQLIQQLQSKDDHQLGELFSTGQVALKQRLDDIVELLHHLDAQQHPVKRLPESSLPFEVLSIDSIQETNVASVRYQFKTQALEKGDSLAGWTVIGVNFATQTIKFENADKALVQLQLKQREVGHV